MALDFPDSPAVGDLYGSPGVVWRWDGEVWSSTSGASGPRGKLAYAQSTTNVNVATDAWVDVGLSVSWTADPTRTYRTSVYLLASSTVGNDDLSVEISDGVGGRKQLLASPYLDPQTSVSVMGAVVETGLSGPVTRVVRATRAGTGTITVAGDPTYPRHILVEDITYEAGSSSQPILTLPPQPKAYTADFATGPRNDNGPMIDLSPILLPASVTGKAQLSFSGECYNALTAMGWALIFDVPDAPTMPYSAHVNQHRIAVPEAGSVPVNNWYSYSSGLLWTPITAGVIPNLRLNVFVGSPGQEWYMSCRVGVLEIPA